MREKTELPRTLTLRDLVLAQVLVVVGTNWMGNGAALGPGGLVLWLVALLVFHLPLAAVVMHLSRACPEEGGLYQWARRAYGPAAGFLVGWNFWLFVMIFMSALGLSAASALVYALAPGSPELAEQGWFLALVAALVVGLLTLFAGLGLRVGKWFHDLGGVLTLGLAGLLALVLIWGLVDGRGGVLGVFSLPELSARNFNLFLKMAVYALAGLECLAIFGGEARQPARDLPRSVALAAPLIALTYMVGTAAILLYVPPAEVDLVNPVAQLLTRAFGQGAVLPLASLVILLLLARDLAQSSQTFAANCRMPMVAGWDGLLPAWLGRLDRRGTPRGAVLLGGAVTLAAALAAIATAGRQEAFQILLSAAGLLFGTTYLVLFSIPLFGARRFGLRPSKVLVAAAGLGLATIVMFLIFSLAPVVDGVPLVPFALKVGGTALLLNLLGAALYAAGHRRPDP